MTDVLMTRQEEESFACSDCGAEPGERCVRLVRDQTHALRRPSAPGPRPRARFSHQARVRAAQDSRKSPAT